MTLVLGMGRIAKGKIGRLYHPLLQKSTNKMQLWANGNFTSGSPKTMYHIITNPILL